MQNKMRIIKVEFVDGNSKSATLVECKNFTPNDNDIKKAVDLACEDHDYAMVYSQNSLGHDFYSATYVDDRNETHIVDVYIGINSVLLV